MHARRRPPARRPRQRGTAPPAGSTATGNVAVTNPGGDTAYGDSIDLTDSLKDGVVENMLVVLNRGGRIAARHGERDDGVVTLDDAAYTPCAVTTADTGCPKEPSWQITAVRVVYDPNRGRISYSGARIRLLHFISIPLPKFSHPVGGANDSGFLAPDVRYNGSNGLSLSPCPIISTWRPIAG